MDNEYSAIVISASLLEEAGHDAKHLTEEELMNIAELVGSHLCECGAYDNALEYAMENYNT